jgi:hypothetical protein
MFNFIKQKATWMKAHLIKNSHKGKTLQEWKNKLKISCEWEETINDEEFIQKVAYLKAEKNNFAGDANFYWYLAENEVENILLECRNNKLILKTLIRDRRDYLRNIGIYSDGLY